MQIPRSLITLPGTVRYIRASYFVGDRFVGSSYDYVLRTNGEAVAIWLRPVAYFCPYCGEVWARKLYQAGCGLPVDFLIEMQPCVRHNSGLLLAWSYSNNEPDRNLLLREVSLLLKGSEWTR